MLRGVIDQTRFIKPSSAIAKPSVATALTTGSRCARPGANSLPKASESNSPVPTLAAHASGSGPPQFSICQATIAPTAPIAP